MATELTAAHFYCFRLLLKTTLLSSVYRITILIPYSLWINVFFGPLKSYFKNEAAACKITRYRTARLVGFTWIKVASVGVGVSAFESVGIYPFTGNRVPEHLFYISYTSETITSMETARPNMALVCVPSTSVTNSQNLLPISAEPSLNTLSTVPPSDTSPEEITYSRFLKKIIPVPKILKIFD